MSLAEIITLITLIAGLIGAIAALIPTFIKLKECLVDIVKNKNWAKIMQVAMSAMKTVEASGKTGADKKQMVVNIVTQSCANLEIELDAELIKRLSDYIDDTIDFVNSMNTNKKGRKCI